MSPEIRYPSITPEDTLAGPLAAVGWVTVAGLVAISWGERSLGFAAVSDAEVAVAGGGEAD